MDEARAIEILDRQRKRISEISRATWEHHEFTKWKRDTGVALQRIFGDSSQQYHDFNNVSYVPRDDNIVRRYTLYLGGYDDAEPFELGITMQNAYNNGLNNARSVLDSIVGEIQEYGLNESLSLIPSAFMLVEQILFKFHDVACQLRTSRQGCSTFEINEEYDVQNLLHALLRIHFDDVRAEEPTPSHAGGGSRADFLLKSERIMIEVKKTRRNMSERELGEQLLADIERYQTHPGYDHLFCFVYDPERLIRNPVGLKNDLEGKRGDVEVRVVVSSG